MMPERLANTDPFKQVTENVGSGPFAFVADGAGRRLAQRLCAIRKVQAPRATARPEWTPGRRSCTSTRWCGRRFPMTAPSPPRFRAGEQDWWENPGQRPAAALGQEPEDQAGHPGSDRRGRDDAAQPPPAALQQPRRPPRLHVGDRPGRVHAGDRRQQPGDVLHAARLLLPAHADASEDGLEPLKGPRNYDKVKEMLRPPDTPAKRRRADEPGDYIVLKAHGDIMADTMQSVGMNVDYVATDWGTMLAAPQKKDPIEQGGWSAFITGWAGANQLDPAAHFGLARQWRFALVLARLVREPGARTPAQRLVRLAGLAARRISAGRSSCGDAGRALLSARPVPPRRLSHQITGVNKGFATFWNVRRA